MSHVDITRRLRCPGLRAVRCVSDEVLVLLPNAWPGATVVNMSDESDIWYADGNKDHITFTAYQHRAA